MFQKLFKGYIFCFLGHLVGRYIFELSARETNLMKKRSVRLLQLGNLDEIRLFLLFEAPLSYLFIFCWVMKQKLFSSKDLVLICAPSDF